MTSSNDQMNVSRASASGRESGGAGFLVQSNAKIWLAAICVFVTIVSLLLCHNQVVTLEQQMVKQQGDTQQTWLDNSLEILGNWQGKLLEQTRLVSQPEAFRFFVHRLAGLGPEELDALTGGQLDYDHPLYALTKERAYHVARLEKLLAGYGWTGCVLAPSGNILFGSADVQAVDAGRRELVDQAVAQRATVYSAMRMEEGKPVMDLVAPLYEVLAEGQPRIVGLLLAMVPLEDTLHRMLAESEVVDASYRPMVLSHGAGQIAAVRRTKDGLAAVAVHNVEARTADGKTTLVPGKNVDAGLQGWAFGRRMGVVGDGEVFSSAKRLVTPGCPNWYVLLEQPATVLDGEIQARSLWIYGIGLLVSIGVSLVLFIIVNQAYFKQRASRAQRCIEGLVHGIECSLDGQGNEGRYLQGRSQKIDKISEMIGRAMHRSDASMETLRLAARLSQVGKIFVPRDLMTKKGLFTNEERRQVQMAPFHAFNVLKGMLPDNVATTIYQMGGKVVVNEETGEIRDLAPAEMTHEARILMVANDFCAMVSQRGSRAPLSYPDARQKLRENKNYDPAVVEALQTIADADLQHVISDGEMSLQV